MPYPNEHSARVHEPGKYTRFARKNIAPGIDAVYGIKEGKSEIQAYRFDKAKYTPAEAKKWLKDHDVDYISFEQASEKREDEHGDPPVRTLHVSIPRALALGTGKLDIKELPDGGILVKGIPILSPGTWTDSATETPMDYTPQRLEEDATNWEARGIWSRHAGPTPRRATEKVGEVRNERYEDGNLTVDLYYHTRTQESRDCLELLKGGYVKAFSVEHDRNEWYNRDKGVYEPRKLTFYGLAQVEQGACPDAKAMERPIGKDKVGEQVEEVEALKQEIADLKAKIADMEKKLAEGAGEGASTEQVKEVAKEAAEEVVEEKVAEIEKKVEAASAELEKMKKKVVELEKTPAPRALSGTPEDRELEDYVPEVRVDPEAKVVEGI